MPQVVADFAVGPRRSRVVSYDSAVGLLDGASLVIADENSAKLLPLPLPADRSVVIPPGEPSKRWERLGELLEKTAARSLRRDAAILGLGGGVVCDLAAFTAALYMRGVRLILVPTTLVAMADAAIGGKSAVDMGGIRNLVGTVYAADEVRLHASFLATLPEREYRAGLAEVLRTGLIAAPKVEDLLRSQRANILSRDLGLLEETVRRCVLAKVSLVERDPWDLGVRMHLNLGHSFGHALESFMPGLLHGEAVAWGIARALDVGLELGITDPDFAASTKGLLADYGFTLSFPALDAEALLGAMGSDKKAVGGGIRLVIPREACSIVVQVVAEALVRRAIEAGTG